MRLALIVALAAGLAACTPVEWVKPDATPEQFDQDMAQCREQAWQEAQRHAWMYRPLGPVFLHDRFGRAVVYSPYGPFYDPFGDRFAEEWRLTNFCMRAKGYELVPAPKK